MAERATPCRLSPGVTGGRSGRVERPDRVRQALCSRCRLGARSTREPEGCFRFIRASRFFKRGNFSFEFGEGTPTVVLVLDGLAFLFGARAERFASC